MTDALAAAREALAGRSAWVVGGAVRDRLLDRPTVDLDLVLDGDVASAARAIARATRAAAFELSDDFGSWRVSGRDGPWQVDLSPLRGPTLEADLALRDFTINAMAEPLAGAGERIDPHGGATDLAEGRLRAVGSQAIADDPLRALRLVRISAELGLEPEPETIALAREQAPRVAAVAQERVFAELKRILAGDGVLRSLQRMDELGLTAAVLPELHALRGIEQNRYHHADVHAHTIEVLEHALALERDPAAIFGDEHAAAITALLREPLSDEIDRAFALRLGALLHDAAKPATLGHRDDGSPTFIGHDRAGAALARDVLTRLRTSERLKSHVAALTRHHLRLGFLVHERPLSQRALYRYLKTCEPVEVDVTLLSVADRLATRGRKAKESIAKHLDVAREVLPAALEWRAQGRRTPLVRGGELAARLKLTDGPELGHLLAEIDEAYYAGEIGTPAEAVAFAARLRETPG
ncbi:MAG: poly(A) polymerase [Solirubrobacteraceae bacterium]|jgi:tRNA nucleotidyltransferase/poly(A) polymerase|nr:poly(A) polymerase [Solirubrobacteraceae bacterium]